MAKALGGPLAAGNADEITSRFPRHSLYVSRLEKRLAWELFRQRSAQAFDATLQDFSYTFSEAINRTPGRNLAPRD